MITKLTIHRLHPFLLEQTISVKGQHLDLMSLHWKKTCGSSRSCYIDIIRIHIHIIIIHNDCSSKDHNILLFIGWYICCDVLQKKNTIDNH